MKHELFLPDRPSVDTYEYLLYSALYRRCLRLIYFHFKNRDYQRANDWLLRLWRIAGVRVPLGTALRLARRIPAFLTLHEYKHSSE